MDEIGAAELADAWRQGAVVDGMAGGRKRVVRSDLLRACCYGLKDQIDPRGMRLSNAIVTGDLDLTGLVVPFALRFDSCEFDAPPVVEGAQLFELWLTGSPRLPGLLGNGLRLRRDLDLSRSNIAGAHWTSGSTSMRSAVWLCESEIGGRLLCVDTVIDGQGDRAIQADRIRVGGSVRLLHKFAARGEIRLIGARINGSVDITGAHLTAVNGPAIELEDAIIEGSMFVIEAPGGRRPEIRGRVGLGSTRISGRLEIRNATDRRQRRPSAGKPVRQVGDTWHRHRRGPDLGRRRSSIRRPMRGDGQHRHDDGRDEQRVHRHGLHAARPRPDRAGHDQQPDQRAPAAGP